MQGKYAKGPSKGNVQAKHPVSKKVWQKEAQTNDVPMHLNKNEPQMTQTESQQNSPEGWKQVKSKSAAKEGVMEVSVAGTNNIMTNLMKMPYSHDPRIF